MQGARTCSLKVSRSQSLQVVDDSCDDMDAQRNSERLGDSGQRVNCMQT
jgi:hypothetical protein